MDEVQYLRDGIAERDCANARLHAENERLRALLREIVDEGQNLADRKRAVRILDHIQRLRDLGAFVERPTRDAELKYISTMLRNARGGPQRS
jgi:hypothetical protein